MRKYEIKKMSKLIINSYEEFAAHLGQKLGESDWLTVDQDRINKFADATLDHQWIHVDVERAKNESPYKSTIAHGYLTLSLLPYMWNQIIEVHNLKMMVNYGMDKMRFGAPVITGNRIKLVASLYNIENLRGICKTQIEFAIEIEGQRKPALQGIASFLYYFK
jgi:acyl dehydratase